MFAANNHTCRYTKNFHNILQGFECVTHMCRTKLHIFQLTFYLQCKIANAVHGVYTITHTTHMPCYMHVPKFLLFMNINTPITVYILELHIIHSARYYHGQ